MKGDEFGASCDANGRYKIDNVTKGDYKVIVSFIGYKDFKDDVRIEDEKVYTIDAFLSIKPILMAKLEIISKSDNPYEDLPGAATVIDAPSFKSVKSYWDSRNFRICSRCKRVLLMME